eukprot:362665-Chlamydomonas_euryale.AAC.6
MNLRLRPGSTVLPSYWPHNRQDFTTSALPLRRHKSTRPCHVSNLLHSLNSNGARLLTAPRQAVLSKAHSVAAALWPN